MLHVSNREYYFRTPLDKPGHWRKLTVDDWYRRQRFMGDHNEALRQGHWDGYIFITIDRPFPQHTPDDAPF